MKIVYLHYHLKPGGVTTVLGQQAAAMRADHEALVIGGSPPRGMQELPVVHLPDLNYDSERRGKVSPASLANSIETAIQDRWPGGCDLIHVHNPTLVKNRALIPALEILQNKGQRLLLQIHDFAEDGRPGVYARRPYPADCHYCVINSRDLEILRGAGLLPEGCHLLPNMVSPLPVADGPPPSRGQVLYPVRAIRRKNIGEALLLSLYLPPAHTLGITLPPNSPADQASYQMWQRLADEALPMVAFAVGVGQPFSKLVQAAPFLITTSITEGFGFSFLEPWTAGRPVWGRRLGAICSDFESHGIDLSHLYPRLRIPLAWIDGADFAARWLAAYARAHAGFDQPLAPGQGERALGAIVGEGAVDFGLLHEDHQAAVIRRLTETPEEQTVLARRQPALGRLGALADLEKRIDHNRRTILDHYGPDIYRRRLETLYAAVLKPVRQRIDKTRLCRAFLKPADFSLLKWSPCHA
jgi:hypothetical protein